MTTTLAKRPTEKAKAEPKPEARGKDANLAARVFERVKQEIFDFVLLPGDRFTEAEIAGRMQVSRTPVREALYLLEREGYLEVMFRSGWRVRPFDFQQFEDLYDVRVILELAAVKRLCEMDQRLALEDLKSAWLVSKSERLTDGRGVAALDEQFHDALVAATGNQEMARIHHDLTERIRIIRRLDFTQDARIDATYNEHARILKAILLRKADEAQMLLKSHIDASKAEVRKITLHMLHTARVQQA
ncbi:MAG TPA: GntR family transcriptional regulator [Burkholderiales bacterium]|jgi:DNA-binding GntR family transcriptional regulator|nr:GntR family transcriptional regulator [Burkholderiales bacterium]